METTVDDETSKLDFCPNPMKDDARMQFVLPESGEAIITIYDLSGRKIVQKRDLLSKGQHIYRIQGVGEGQYIVKISSGRYSYSGRLVILSAASRINLLKVTTFYLELKFWSRRLFRVIKHGLMMI